LKKYFEAAKIMFKTQLVYRFDVITGVAFSIFKILLACILWSAVFEKKEVVSGFTFHTMLTYYLITGFISQLDQSAAVGWQVSSDIRNGRFSKYMIRPIGIFRYFASQSAGSTAFLLIFNVFAAGVWIFLFKIEFTMSSDIKYILAACVLIVLGLLFMVQLHYFIGILAFKFLDVTALMMMKENIVQFLTGALIPLTLLPLAWVQAMTYFPFYYISYLPTMLLLGRNSDECISGIMILVLWNIAFGIINAVTYQHLKSIYDGVGI
jgi:ABC-2 type transport system permease protein